MAARSAAQVAAQKKAAKASAAKRRKTSTSGGGGRESLTTISKRASKFPARKPNKLSAATKAKMATETAAHKEAMRPKNIWEQRAAAAKIDKARKKAKPRRFN